MILNEILSINENVKKLIDETDLDIKLKFKLLTILKEIEPYVSNFEILKNEKIVKYGTKNEDGSVILNQTDENFKKCVDEITELAKTDVQCKITKLKADEVFNNTDIKTDVLLLLYPLIEE